MDLEKLLFHHILPQILDLPATGSETMITVLSNYIFDQSRMPSESWLKQLNHFSIVPIKSLDPQQPQQYRRIEALVDPKSTLAELYFDSEDVWPKADFLKQHYHALEACGLPNRITENTAIERARFYSRCDDIKQALPKVCCLLATAIDFSMPALKSSVNEIVNLPWLPAKRNNEEPLTLLPPSQCRGGDEAKLVNYVLGTFDSTVRNSWKILYVLFPRF